MKFRVWLTVSLLTLLWLLFSTIPKNRPDSGIGLIAPRFVDTAYAQEDSGFNFLLQEAGLTAYANIEQPIDLSSVRRFFTTIDDETENYLIGSVTAPGYEELTELEETMDIHVFVHREGWVTAYLLHRQSAGMLIDWVGYDGDKLNSTTLADTVLKVLAGTSGAGSTVSYYDFRYPEATTIEIIADVETDNNQIDVFELEVPSTFTVFESAWSHGTLDSDKSSCGLNSEDYSKFEERLRIWRISFGNFTQTRLSSGDVNSLYVYNDDYSSGENAGRTYCGIVLVYKEG